MKQIKRKKVFLKDLECIIVDHLKQIIQQESENKAVESTKAMIVKLNKVLPKNKSDVADPQDVRQITDAADKITALF